MREFAWLTITFIIMSMIFLGSAAFVIGVLVGIWLGVWLGWQIALTGLLALVVGGVGALLITD